VSGLRPIAHLFTQPSAAHSIELLGLVLVLAATAFLLCRLSVTTIFTIAIALELFSGNWKYMHIPLPLDRIFLLLAIGIVFYRGWRRVSPGRRLVISPIHLLLAAVVVYAILSAWGAGTLTTSLGFYALLDRLGVIPFLMFTLAPLVFGSTKNRNILLVMLVVVGFYLGATAFFEGIGVNRLVFPGYINNPAVGIHYGRARGPFGDAAANGLCMFICGAAALVALTLWRSRYARLLCYATVLLSTTGVLFTLTREAWLGAVAGVLAVAIYDRRLRRYVPAILLGGVLITVALLVFVPGLSNKVTSRATDQGPVWARYNTDRAALLAWEEHPVFGIGWETFISTSPNYLRQAPSYPLNGAGVEVHNVFLSHLAELGAVGALLWLWALVTGVGGAAFSRGPPELYPWRLALIGIFVCFVVVANLGPLSYPLPNLLLWLWAGIVAADRYSAPRSTSSFSGTQETVDGLQTLSVDNSTSRAKSGIS
jgi:putative inorganic carbon (hco3(-)) transporter